MKILLSEKEMQSFFKVLRERASGRGQEVENRVRAILDDVRKTGDSAVLRYTKAFDSLTKKDLRITPEEI